MNILEELISILSTLNIPIETGVFKDETPDEYIVLVPLLDTYPISADDFPLEDVQEVRISLFTKGNYIQRKNLISAICMSHYFFITGRTYNGYDTETSYHQYTIDVAKNYGIENEEEN